MTVAVDKFILNMRGGNRGLPDNSDNLCKRKRFAFLNLKAQNSRRLKTNRLRLNIRAAAASGAEACSAMRSRPT
jgi:hypothetical protein